MNLGPQKPVSPTRRRARRVFAVLAVLAGAGLIVLELSRITGGGNPVEGWVWILIAVVLLMLGVAEWLGLREPPPRL